MAFTNFMVNRPCVYLCISFTILIILTAAFFFFELYEINEDEDRTYLVDKHPIVIEFDKSKMIREIENKLQGLGPKEEKEKDHGFRER